MNVSVILATFEGCNAKQINSPDFFEEVLKAAADAGSFTILHTYIHPFSPQGLTGAAVLAESHITLHSWPETGTLFIDLATCSGEEATWAAFEKICELVEHQSVRPQSLQCPSRPAPPPLSLITHRNELK
ncbi:MAG: adenosylmethionine decarboxylase [Myxococcota bacterium]|nr:adenosylmethionine decarboxylase [Myxococcota bacterium]